MDENIVMTKKEYKKEKRMKIVALLTALLIVTAVFFAGSYAFFLYNKSGTKTISLAAGKIEVKYIDGTDNISMNNAYPMTEAQGLRTNPFTFKIINSGNTNLNYTVELIDDISCSITMNKSLVIVDLNKNGTNVKKTTASTSTVIYSTTIYPQKEDKFDLRLWLDSTAGNDQQNKTYCGKIKVTVVDNRDESTDNSNASYPELYDNMIPVKYNGTNWVTTNLSEKWYDYDRQEWANAIVVDKSEYETYKIAGTVIPEDKILLMYVWIPRYEYTIYKGTDGSNIYGGGTKGQPGMIDIKFVNKATSKVMGTANYSSVSQGTNVSGYRTHEAFTFGDTELNGIWVAKFETTGTLAAACTNETCNVSNITSKPNQPSLRTQTISSFFFASRSLQQPNNKFGFTDTVNSHMMKNSEWGAVAYLTQSKYGKAGNSNYTGIQKEVYINNSEGYYTGRSGGIFLTGGIQKTTTEQYGTGDTNKYNQQGYYTYDGKAILSDGTVSIVITDTSSGYGASTTGTIYGIYDMSGGAGEYVMGWLTTASATFGSTSSTNHAGFKADPGNKYWSNYTGTSSATGCNNGICYGDSLSETFGWNSDYNVFLNGSLPWFARGGYYNGSSDGGLFSFLSINGSANRYESSRAVLTAK